MGNKKKGRAGKKKTKSQSRDLNASAIQSLKRLFIALKELGEIKSSSSNGSVQTSSAVKGSHDIELINIEGKIAIGLPLNHWREIPPEVQQAYKMLHDGAEHIKATSTKYTLLSKISIEDGSKLSDELRQGCELISTSAFLVHQEELGCAQSTRRFIKLRAKSIVSAVITLIESMQSLHALNGNVGAQLTGVLWGACDEALKVPQGNRACIRRDFFTWVGECNETMQEFQDLIKESQSARDEGTANGPIQTESANNWDDFCVNLGTGEKYSSKELPIVVATLALIKCSRGVLGLAIKASDCAGDVVAEIDQKTNEKNEIDTSRRSSILQWISNIHETSRKISKGMTDLGCLMYPPLNLDLIEVKGKDGLNRTITEFEIQVLKQKNYLMAVAHFINDATPHSGERAVIPMSDEVKEMSSKLLTATGKRADEAAQGILQFHERSHVSD